MILFVDTSALIAVLDADDEFHTPAKTYWAEANCVDTVWTASNYVVLETFAVIQRRLGMQAVTVFLMMSCQLSILNGLMLLSMMQA